MSSESEIVWQSSEREIFLDALEKRSPSERAAFLHNACAGNPALRQRVEDLLREHEVMGSFLDAPALVHKRTGTSVTARAGFTPGDLMAAVTEQPGDWIGRYKLLQKIGEGGCGVVYMAEQQQPVRRRVALKVIKLGMDTKSVIARFEAERQALAMMDHPNIAKVFDAGATDTGRPYFVMELVRGIRITEYCDQNNLSTQERLKLLIQVCQAIQHAHQKGIIHRDIKPSNILVTLHDGVAVPKVIDFGIAKATEQRLTDKTLFTEFTAFIGTPAYMSPEQAEMSGLDIDTRSDIYALGVLLYELLTGRTPFDSQSLMRRGIDECRRTIREDEPQRPSTRLATMIAADLTTAARQRRTDGVRLVNSLRGDLDWIVMKCLEKDRTRRYVTANALGTELQRYLDDEPVSARPPSNWYRLQKLVRRHRTAVAAAVVVSATLIAATTMSSWLAIRATQAERKQADLRATAEEEWKRAEAERAAARLNEYVADINLAQRSLADGNFGRAVQLLDKHRPARGELDLRGFEWRYLAQVSQGDEHVVLPSQDGAVQSVAFHPSGQFVALGLRDHINILDLENHTLVASNNVRFTTSMAFLQEGNRLVTASPLNVNIWNTTNWLGETQPEDRLTNAAGPITLSPDGTLLATDSARFRSRGVRIWNTRTWELVRTLPNASAPFAFSPDGTEIATDTQQGITVWTIDENNGSNRVLEQSDDVFNSRGPRGERHLAFSPDGNWIVAAQNRLSERGVFVLNVWDAETGSHNGVLPENPEHIEHLGSISSVVFSPDGKTLATASWDYTIRLWDFAARKRVTTLHGHLNEVWAIAFSPDGRTILSGAKDGGVKMWRTARAANRNIVPGIRKPLAFSTDSRLLAALTTHDSVVFLNLATGEPQREFEVESRRGFGPPGFGPPLAISRDFRWLAHAASGGDVNIIDTASGHSRTIKAADRNVEFVALSPDGNILITGGGRDRSGSGREASLQWRDLRDGDAIVAAVDADRVIFSPDGGTLAAFRREQPIQVWDVATRSLRFQLVFESEPGFAAEFSPDGKRLATTSGRDDTSNTIHLWDTVGGTLVSTFVGHKQPIWSVAFSPDGRSLASASDDSTLKIWNIATQQELLTFRHLGGMMNGLIFSPDGRLLVAAARTASESHGLRLYRAGTFADLHQNQSGHALR